MHLFHRAMRHLVTSERPPVVFLLHGVGADEEDLLPLARGLDPRLLVVAVRAPDEEGPVGFRWYRIDWATTPPRADPEEVARSRERLGRFVEEATRALGADPARVFLYGFSQGAIMSLALLLARPDLVRGVVAHSGRLVKLPGVEPAPAALARAHVLLLHGAEDEVVTVDLGRKAREVLRPLLGDRLAYREYPRLGHAISEESAGDAARWLASQVDA
jgi:phospholipase/carboxylesterase